METPQFIMAVGAIVAGLAGLWMIITAFSVSVMWGLAVMFIPFANLFFIVTNWSEAKAPFFLSLLGGFVLGIGIAMYHPPARPKTPVRHLTMVSPAARMLVHRA